MSLIKLLYALARKKAHFATIKKQIIQNKQFSF